MKQLKKRHVLSAGFIGVGSLIGQANADTVAYTNLNGGIVETNSGAVINTERVKEREREGFENFVANLRAEYPWIKQTNEPLNGDYRTKQKELQKLRPLFREVERLRAQVIALRQQAAQNGTSLNISVTKAKTSDELKQKKIEFERQLRELSSELVKIPSVTLDTSIMKMIRDTNIEIQQASEINNHIEDGIIGNLDDVHRAAYDSKQNNAIHTKKGDKPGVVINTDETTKGNLVETEMVQVGGEVVHTVSEAISARSNALKKIADTQKESEAEAIKAGIYRDNALLNIKNINTWLIAEHDRANTISGEINKNVTSIKDMDAVKANATKVFDEAERLIKASGKPQATIDRLLASLNDAKKKIADSSVSAGGGDAVAANDQSIDFGDIGRDPNEVRRIINETKAALDSRVNGAIANLQGDNAGAQAVMDNWKKDINAQLSQYLNNIRAGKFGVTQIDESWLSTRDIYKANSKGYAANVKSALSQTSGDASSVLTKQGNMLVANDNTSIAKVVAGLYTERLKSGNDAPFGSVMLPSDNINDFATVDGQKLANSQRDGGVEAVVNKLNGMFQGNGGRAITELPVLKNMMTRHVEKAGATKTFMVVSEKPTATFKLKNSFLYVNQAGEFKTTDMSVKLSVTDADGSAIGEPSMGVSGEKTVPLYFYYLSVDSATGKLVAGGGYYGFVRTSGAGEATMTLGSDTDSNDEHTLSNLLSGGQKLGEPEQAGNPYLSKGIRLTVDTKVNQEAGDYATNAPVYVSDIEDNQKIHTSGTVAVTKTSAPKFVGSDTVSEGTTSGPHDGHLNFSNHSILTTDNGPVGISHKSDGSNPYQVIDVGLYAPWGIVGGQTPGLNIKPFTHVVRAFSIKEPSAKAHTAGHYTVKKAIGSVLPKGVTASAVKNLNLPEFEVPLTTSRAKWTDDQRGAASTSIVVKRLTDTLKRAGSGNSMVVRNLPKHGAIVKTITSGDGVDEAIVRSIQNIARVEKTDGGVRVKSISSPLTLNKGDISLNVYVDPSLRDVANEAIKDWQRALSKHGINLRVTGKRSATDLSILDSDNRTTRAARTIDTHNVSDDSGFEMKGLAGLTTFTRQVGIVDLDSDDKLNKNGTFTINDLKKSKHVVQINSEAISGRNNLIKVMKHELGHVFGLQHDNKNPLMTTYYNDSVFTGEITDETAAQVAANLRGGRLCQCASCAGLLNR